MTLLSLFRKKQQDSPASEGDFQSRAEEESADLSSAGKRTKRTSQRQLTEPVDPMLPEKKRARRRLIGAVALVLAAIIGLPMILDVEQKPLGTDVAIQIPSKDQVSPTNLASSSGLRVAANAALDPSEEVVSGLATPAKTDPPVGAPLEPAATVDKAAPQLSVASPKAGQTILSDQQSDARPAAKSEAATVPSKNTAKAPPDEALHSDSARAQSILDGGEATAKPEKKNAKMIVQVAALASKEKVSELRDKLKAAGIASYTQTVATESGPRIRVRIGPFVSRQEADAARSKLTRIGLNGTLVPN